MSDHFTTLRSKALKKQCLDADNLLVACGNWYCHIWSQYDKSFLRYHGEIISTTVKGALSGLRQFIATESPLKTMKNVF